MPTFDEILRNANRGVEQTFRPGYETPTADRLTDETGRGITQTTLNPFLYADQKTADYLANRLGATQQNAIVSGPLGVSAPQRELQFAPGTAGLNAGLVGQQYGFATQGRYNADTGKYDLEAPHVVQARINADIAREMGQPWQASYAPSPQEATNNWGWNPNTFAAQPGNTGGARVLDPTPPRSASPAQPPATPPAAAPPVANPSASAPPVPADTSTPAPRNNPLGRLNVTATNNPFHRSATADSRGGSAARNLPSSMAARGFRIQSTPSSWRF